MPRSHFEGAILMSIRPIFNIDRTKDLEWIVLINDHPMDSGTWKINNSATNSNIP